MRRLYYVPVLHTSADMGSLAPSLDEIVKAEMGQEAWQRHKEAKSVFWDCVGRFFEGLDVRGFKVYQDGMVADGPDGVRIVKELSIRGSKNYQIVEGLMERGAILVKTENLALVKQEYAHVTRIARAGSLREKEVWSLRYRLAQPGLLQQRDDFIANRIKETLGEGETGILFVGAHHVVLPRLPQDIEVLTVGRSEH